MKKRIWELDLLRGVFILAMVAIHLITDLVYVFDIIDLTDPFLKGIYTLSTRWGGILFILLSGICVNFSSHPVRRGLVVTGCGLLVTGVSAGMYLLGFLDQSILIWFGILHCLGVSMVLWPVFKRLHPAALLGIGIIMAAAGLYLEAFVRVDHFWLIPFGVLSPTFSSADYFPLLPNFGYFLVGSALGKWFYPKRQTLFPGVDDTGLIIRFFTFFGRNSLLVYLLHQPLLAGLVWLWDLCF